MDINININDPNYTNKYMDVSQRDFNVRESITENIGFMTISELNEREGQRETSVKHFELLDVELSKEEAKKQYWPFIE